MSPGKDDLRFGDVSSNGGDRDIADRMEQLIQVAISGLVLLVIAYVGWEFVTILFL